MFKNLNAKTIEMLTRAFMRSAALAFLLIVAGLLLDFLIDEARLRGSSIPERFPEILVIFRSAAILTWFELSAFWIRLATSPKIDLQDTASLAAEVPMGAAAVYATQALKWGFRMAIMMQLCGFWE